MINGGDCSPTFPFFLVFFSLLPPPPPPFFIQSSCTRLLICLPLSIHLVIAIHFQCHAGSLNANWDTSKRSMNDKSHLTQNRTLSHATRES